MSLDSRTFAFASTLAVLAGYVDAAGFMLTGGYFVSFMSGNSTRMAVGFAEGALGAVLAAALIGVFVGGVMLGAVIRRLDRRRPEVLILAILTGLLALCGLLATADQPLAAALVLAAAMGLENTVFAVAGDVKVGLTYMTGALVKTGKGIVAALFGETGAPWVRHLILWLSLVAGAVAGAVAYGRFGAPAIWVAVAGAAGLALASLKLFPQDQPE